MQWPPNGMPVNGTLYSQISPVSFSEFTPSRETRVSSNPFLQEHCPFSKDKLQNRRKVSREERPNALSQRKYAQLEFSVEQKPFTDSVEDVYSTIRRYKSSHAESGFHPESVIGYTTDFLFEEDQDEGDSILSLSYPGPGHHTRRIITQSPQFSEHDTLMDRPISFALAIGENPILFDGETSVPIRDDMPSTGMIPQESSNTDNTRLYQNISSSSLISSQSSEPSSEPDQSTVYYDTTCRYVVSLPSSPGSPPTPLTDPIQPTSLVSYSPLLLSRSPHRQNCASSMDNLIEPDQAIDSSSPIIINRLRCDSSSTPNLLQTSLDTKRFDDIDRVSLMESYGRYSVSYLGSKDIDSYSNCINECARKMLDPSTKVPLVVDNVNVDIKSEKVRLLQPKSGALLKSISMHNIFMYSQCSKNKRLIGIVVWKQNTLVPICHLFRCIDQHVSNAFMESLSSAKQDIGYRLIEKVIN